MEVIAGGVHRSFVMDDASRTGEARRHCAQLAQDLDFDETAAGRVAIVVTELCGNLARHAHGGRLWARADAACGMVELLAVDQGPGIADVDASLRDGYSTGGTPGTGLGAVRRLADAFDLVSVPGTGTVVLARIGSGSPGVSSAPEAGAVVRCGGVALSAPGETVSGDAWSVARTDARAAAMMVDGLGHGPEAAHAAAQALAVFREEPYAAPRELIARTHAALRTTRGAAVAVVHLDAQAGVLRSAGVGNIVGRIVSGVADRTLLWQHGTAGVAVRTLEEVTTPWPEHALVILFTDGLATRWPAQCLIPALARDPVLAAALLVRDHCRGRDDATALVLGRAS